MSTRRTETVENRDGVDRVIVREHRDDGYTSVKSARRARTTPEPVSREDYDNMF